MATNINFQQQASAGVTPKKQRSSKGLLFAFIILIVTLIIFAGMKFYARSLENKEAAVDEQIVQAKQALNKDELSAVIDFNERLSIIDKTLAQNTVTSGVVLSDVATVIVPRVVLSSFQHERDAQTGDDIVSFGADADNFDLIAQQLASLKASQKFSDITVGDTGINDTGRITFEVRAKYDGSGVASTSIAQPQPNNDAVPTPDPAVEGVEPQADAVPENLENNDPIDPVPVIAPVEESIPSDGEPVIDSVVQEPV